MMEQQDINSVDLKNITYFIVLKDKFSALLTQALSCV